MKHIVLSHGFKFSSEPFSAFRCDLFYGRNKKDKEFLPVQGVPVQQTFRVVTRQIVPKILYEGTDRAEAEQAKADHEALPQEEFQSVFTVARQMSARPRAVVELLVTGEKLPDDQFKLITTQQKGTRLIVAGADKTTDALVFLGESEGFRGGVRVVPEGTTAEIVKSCQAGSATEGRIEIIARFEVGQTVAIYSYGRRTNNVHLYSWDGMTVEKKTFSKAEWDTIQEIGM